MVPVFLFTIGMIVLLASTSQLIKLTTRLAHSLRLSPLIVGITVVAIGTSMPELVVSSIASIKGDFGLAVGNVLGSNVINILLVLSLGILTGRLRVGTTKTQKNIIILTAVSFVYLVSFWLKIPGWITGTIFLGLAVLFTFTQYLWGVAGRRLEDKVMLRLSRTKKLSLSDYLSLGGCLMAVFIGGSLIVYSVEQIAFVTGYSTNMLGLSITAIATSLPEIVATLIGMRQKEDKLLLGNIMGSNVYNILLIGGISSFWIKNYTVPTFEAGFFILSTLLLLDTIVMYKGKIIPKFVGLGMIVICVGYFAVIYYK